jgi:hypothetical protein
MSVGLSWDVEVTPEEEDELLKKIAMKMHDLEMEIPAIIFLETVKPLSFIGSQMGRFLLAPFLPILGDELELTGAKLIRIFENRQNMEKIIQHIEELARKKEDRKRIEKEKKVESNDKQKKEGWRKFIPF